MMRSGFTHLLLLANVKMTDFHPLNDAETFLAAAMGGQMPMAEFMKIFLASTVELPSANEVHADGAGLIPILFDKEGTNMLALFTHKDRIAPFRERASYCVSMKAIDVLRRLPPGYGVVINPGGKFGFDISSEGVREILRDFD